MITLDVVNASGDKVSTIDIDPTDFGGEINKQLLHDAIVMYQANLRQGTVKTKTRGEVAGSGKKMYRQKGTGNARMGSKRTAKRRGGGTCFGPKPRDFSYAMPRKARRLATRMALLSKLQDNEAVVLDGFSVDGPKTKTVVSVLQKLGLADTTCLIATEGMDRNFYLSARNIKGVEVLPAQELNALSLLKNRRLLVTLSALKSLQKSQTETANA